MIRISWRWWIMCTVMHNGYQFQIAWKLEDPSYCSADRRSGATGPSRQGHGRGAGGRAISRAHFAHLLENPFFISPSWKSTSNIFIISLFYKRPCGAIYNLAGHLVINWRPRAAAHSDATADDAFCSEGAANLPFPTQEEFNKNSTQRSKIIGHFVTFRTRNVVSSHFQPNAVTDCIMVCFQPYILIFHNQTNLKFLWRTLLTCRFTNNYWLSALLEHNPSCISSCSVILWH